MKRTNGLALAIVIALQAVTVQGTYGAAPGGLAVLGGKPSLAPTIKKIAPAVVAITVRKPAEPSLVPSDDAILRRFLGLPDLPADALDTVAGSGIIFDGPRGLIVTNSHLVDEADSIKVRLADGREVMGILQGSDADTDVAVIKINLPNLPVATFADSDRLEVGDYVFAIGNPFGIGQTVTSGIVSGLRRSGMGLDRYEDFIQTDAAINPGNSGGALADSEGEVVGINAAMLGGLTGNAGISFAIPINMVRVVVAQLMEYGSVERGNAGFTVSDAHGDLAHKYGERGANSGAVVTQVDPNSPADAAGLHVGDLIVAMGEVPVRGAADLRVRLGLMRAGKSAELTVMRGGKSLHIRATLLPKDS